MQKLTILLILFGFLKGYSQSSITSLVPVHSSTQTDNAIKIADANIKAFILQQSFDPPLKSHKKIETLLTDTLTYLEVANAQINFMDESESKSPGTFTKLLIKEKARREKLIANGTGNRVEHYCFFHTCELVNTKGTKMIRKYFVSTDNVYNVKALGLKSKHASINLLKVKYGQTKGFAMLVSN